MISYSEALAILYEQPPLEHQTLLAKNSCGYICAENVTSRVFVPPFANAAMDGFAVRSVDIANASAQHPVTLPITGSTVAGDKFSTGTTGAWEIMTGASVPEAYDAVVKIEDIAVSDNTVTFSKPTQHNNNIRQAGEDITPDDIAVKEGEPITPFHVMALATIGHKEVRVALKPNITVFSTGKEIIEDCDTFLQSGQIRNSNGPYLMAALSELPVKAYYAGIIADEALAFESAVQEVLPNTKIFISTGAVSAGKHDFIPDSLRKLGAEILFHKVCIRPGKPILYARFTNGTHYFGLPGNPASAAVGLRFFVIPLLRRLLGMEQEKPITAKLLASHRKKSGLAFFCKAYVSVSDDGQLQAKILDGQESFKISPLLEANGWAILPASADNIEAGDMVQLYPLMPECWNLGDGV